MGLVPVTREAMPPAAAATITMIKMKPTTAVAAIFAVGIVDQPPQWFLVSGEVVGGGVRRYLSTKAGAVGRAQSTEGGEDAQPLRRWLGEGEAIVSGISRLCRWYCRYRWREPTVGM